MTTGIFKRTAIVAALATAGMAAHADALPFSFYALVDVGVGNTTVTGTNATTKAGTSTEVRSSGIDPSFWGFTIEKTEKGVTAGFQSESTINVTNMSGTAYSTTYTNKQNVATSFSDRQANLYVKTDALGKLEAGTVTDPVFDALLTVEPTSSGYGNTINVWFGTVQHANNSPTSDTGAIKYTSPTIGGFTAKVSYVGAQTYSTVAGGTNAQLGSGVRAAINYNYGDLNIVGGYESTNSTSNGTNLYSLDLLGANYKVGSFTLKGIYLINKDTNTYQIDYGSLKTTGFGGSYDINEKLQLNSGYYQSKDAGAGGKANYQNATMWTTYLTYDIIKDLKVYGEYSSTVNKASNSSANAFGFTSNYGTGAAAGTGTISQGQSAKSVIVGLHYAFF